MKYLKLATIVLTGALVFCAMASRAQDVTPPSVVSLPSYLGYVMRLPTLKDEGERYATIEEAAVHAAEGMYRFSHYYESGGVITRIDGKFAVGRLRTDWSGRFVNIDYDPRNYEGVIVGDYHAHPCNTNHFVPGSFSDGDLLSYRTFHVDGFLLNMCTGEIHEFKQGVDKDMGDYLETEGHVVGKIPVDGKVTDTAEKVDDQTIFAF